MFEPYRKFPSMNAVAVLVCARGPENIIEGVGSSPEVKIIVNCG
jgi:hypothetical protein